MAANAIQASSIIRHPYALPSGAGLFGVCFACAVILMYAHFVIFHVTFFVDGVSPFGVEIKMAFHPSGRNVKKRTLYLKKTAVCAS